MFFTQNIRAGAALLGFLAALFAAFLFLHHFPAASHKKPPLLVAIANFGPHPSLEASIQGLKDGLAQQGVEVVFEEKHVNFDAALIPQMLAQMIAKQPAVVVALTTPVAQRAVQQREKTSTPAPLVFSAITDPEAAGLERRSGVTGTSDQQDFDALMAFVQKLLPRARRIGVLYGTGEAGDGAFVRMMRGAATHVGLELVAVPVDHARDIPLRMGLLKDVDVIYVGVSGTIQPALPAIVAAADRMHIPVINTDADAVAHHHVLASFGASPYQVGVRTADIVGRILHGEKADDIPIIYPGPEDHQAALSHPRAAALGIQIPEDRTLQIVE